MKQVQGLEVLTESGYVRGTMASESVQVFKGIPYASPPVGQLRWRPPVPSQPWPGVLEVVEFGPDCPQQMDVGSRAPRQSEDCLYLNIWRPHEDKNSRLPVMIWIHGGSYISGSGSEERLDGTNLAQKGVIVITINYRVGLFGFLAHPQLTQESPQHSSGNYGLLDQICALRWVKNNIAAFGGDPDRVTAFGVSAGSASISLLLASPMGEHLFDQAILESPGTARPLASLATAESVGLVLGDDIESLRELSDMQILERTSLLAPKVRGLTTPRILRPIRDGWVIPEDERPVLKSGRLHRMPIIVGTNADEGFEATATWPIKTVTDYLSFIDSNFSVDDAKQKVLSLYSVESDAQVPGRVAELFGDTQFDYGARLLAQSMVEKEPRTWRYLFTRRRAHRRDGPHHGQEVHYVFGNLAARYPGELPDYDHADVFISKAMMSAWVAFAKSGNPNCVEIPDWPSYVVAEDNYFEFGNGVRKGRQWRKEQLDFLDRFFEGSFDRGR